MSSGDATCPECGEPISATASYCMHCYADLPSGPVDGSADQDRGWGDSDDQGWSNDDGGGWSDGPNPDGERGGAAANEPTGPVGDDGRTGPTPGAETQGTAPPTADAQAQAGGQAPAGGTPSGGAAGQGRPAGADDQFLDPDGTVDNTLTVIVGIVGGIVVGIVSTIALGVMLQSGYGLLLGFIAWIGSTAYLVRRRTVQGAVSSTGYAIAVVLLLIPFAGFSPLVSVEGGIGGRFGWFAVGLFTVAVPALIFGIVGFVAGQFVPEQRSVG